MLWNSGQLLPLRLEVIDAAARAVAVDSSRVEEPAIEAIKFAAAASKTQQPNDVSVCFRSLKSAAESGSKEEPAWYTRLLDGILLPLGSTSRRTYKKFLGALPEYLAKAFNVGNIKEGWRLSGLYPLDFGRIMTRCGSWGKLHPEQSIAIFEALPKLVDVASTFGEVPEHAFTRIVGPSIDFDRWIADLMGRSTKR